MFVSDWWHGIGEGAQKGSSNGDYSQADMKKVWQKTKQDCDAGHYTLGGRTVQLEPHLSDSAKGTYKRTISIWQWLIELIFGEYSRPAYESKGCQTQITVVDRDAIEEAVSLKENGYNPALLNPANAYTPGGGYKNGARAMEEDICRRSGLALTIDSVHKRVRNFYPLRSESLLYNPSVPIFRYGRDRAYSYMNAPVPVSIITSAAVDLGRANFNDKSFQKETEKRIYAQLAVAAEQGHDAVVLTAFGCGAFRNRPETVAKIYKRVIERQFSGVFKKITFAVINDHNTGQAHNPRGNFKPFKEMLGNGSLFLS